MSTTPGEPAPELVQALRKAVSDAYYDARNAYQTMEMAADKAVANLLPIITSVDANAHQRGYVMGIAFGIDKAITLLQDDPRGLTLAFVKAEAEAAVAAIR